MRDTRYRRVRRFAVNLLLLGLLSCSSSPPNPVDGLITAIDGRTLTLRTDAGDTYRFQIADPAVPLGHLRVHQRERLPVLITWRTEGEDLVAESIADAPA